jgi:ribosomal protein S18 acetylase RimI-like enzyme
VSAPHLRDAVAGDAPAIAAVVVATWRDAYAGLLPDDVLAGLSVAEREAQWRRFVPATAPACCLVTGSPVCGFVAAGPALQGAGDGDGDGDAVGQVYAIYVLPSSQGRRLGAALLAAAESRLAAAGFATASLWVLTSNTPARRFYESRGWRTTGETQVEEFAGTTLRETRYTHPLG